VRWQPWTVPFPTPNPAGRSPIQPPYRTTRPRSTTLEGAIETATAGVRQDDRDIAVAFSGGVDSALVAELLDAPLYVVGFSDSHDVAAARRPPMRWGATSTVVDLEPADLERAFRR